MDHKEKHSTEWALLYPLKAGLFAAKHSSVTRSTDRFKKKSGSTIADDSNRLCIRRGSSMSELDKLSEELLPDLVRSNTANHYLTTSPASLPHSPYFSRSALHVASTRDSIGDLMNQKKYGSSQWSVRSETLIARVVPLSTVTPRHSPPTVAATEESPDECSITNEFCSTEPLTTAQRAQRLSRLIKRQRSTISKPIPIMVSVVFLKNMLYKCYLSYCAMFGNTGTQVLFKNRIGNFSIASDTVRLLCYKILKIIF